MNYDELVRAAEQSSEEAARQLGDAGVDALPAVLHGLADRWTSHGLLPTALERILLRAPVNVVLEVFDSGSLDAVQAVLRASVSRPEARLRQGLRDRLRDRLRDEDQLSSRRAEVAAFFGDLADASTTRTWQTMR